MSKSFIIEIAPHAQKAGKENNILSSIIIAQACLESNYGKSGLATKGFNLFGIKGSYNGKSVTMRTAEYKAGKKYYIDAAFRKYPSWYESLTDLCNLYIKGVSWDRNKYKKVIGEKNYSQCALNIQKAGYATDPAYASKLVSIIETFNLSKYDAKKSAETIKTIVAKKPAAAKPAATKTVTVKPGDTLSELAGTNDKTKLQAIAKKNKLKNIHTIYVGQKIKL